LLPVFLIFYIGSIAETNRAPFDLAEAESELVSGFMTEHAAVIFVFFFLAEYASIVLICTLTTILFLGGYLYYNIINIYIDIYVYITKFFNFNNYLYNNIDDYSLNNPIIEGLLYSFSLGIKTCVLIFIFI
jgi:NADH-ubiquinone oxidoreductase chain 1